MKQEDFVNIVFFYGLFVKAFQKFSEYDINKNERLTISEFMQYLISEKIDLTNPFREFHLMDKEKDHNIGVEKFI